jgi:hypothetical protein
MTFRLECDEDVFQLVLVLPDEERSDIPLDYFSVSTVVADGGMVCGCYMNGSEPEFRALEQDPDPDKVSAVSQLIKVYDLTNWPTITPINATVTIQLTELEAGEPDGDEDEDGQDDEAIEVTPIS